MYNVMMKCGHAASAIDGAGNPVCAICVGISRNAEIVEESPLDLSQREAKCLECGKARRLSSVNLAFFQSRPDKEFDGYYCGCMGWN